MRFMFIFIINLGFCLVQTCKFKKCKRHLYKFLINYLSIISLRLDIYIYKDVQIRQQYNE